MIKTITLHDNIARSKGQLSVSIIINKKKTNNKETKNLDKTHSPKKREKKICSKLLNPLSRRVSEAGNTQQCTERNSGAYQSYVLKNLNEFKNMFIRV